MRIYARLYKLQIFRERLFFPWTINKITALGIGVLYVQKSRKIANRLSKLGIYRDIIFDVCNWISHVCTHQIFLLIARSIFMSPRILYASSFRNIVQYELFRVSLCRDGKFMSLNMTMPLKKKRLNATLAER